MIIWLTGLPASGKTTIAMVLASRLLDRGQRVEVLDGDTIRAALSPGLGFSEADRNLHIRRIGWLAQTLERHDITVIVSAISPYRAIRDEVRAKAGRFIEVFVDTPLDVCRKRDTKGTYQRQGVTGVDAPYEEPLTPEVHLYPDMQTVAESVDAIVDYLGLDSAPVRYSLFIGRWQVPFLHDGHKALIQTALDEGRPVCVGIRDTALSDTDPYTVAERRAIIEAAFPGIRTCVLPDIAEIVFGRQVGYGIRELHLAPELEAISGTAIRNGQRV
jgi:adenylylsulfate kinase